MQAENKDTFLNLHMSVEPSSNDVPSPSLLQWFHREQSKVQELSSLISNVMSTVHPSPHTKETPTQSVHIFTALPSTDRMALGKNKSSIPFSTGKHLCKLVKALEPRAVRKSNKEPMQVQCQGKVTDEFGLLLSPVSNKGNGLLFQSSVRSNQNTSWK